MKIMIGLIALCAGVLMVSGDALAIVGKCRCTSALFAVRAKKADSMRAFINQMMIDSVMEMLGYRTEK